MVRYISLARAIEGESRFLMLSWEYTHWYFLSVPLLFLLLRHRTTMRKLRSKL